ncbi:MAG TPA: D-Ala-D-Ala carboxypeptidase family metallohydrolase [Longimicrobiales bacterium]
MESRRSSIVIVGVVALGWIAPAESPWASRPQEATASESSAEAGGLPAPATVQSAAIVDLEVGYRPEALGHSRVVRVWPVLPGERLTLPLEWREPRPERVSYRWVVVEGTEESGAVELVGVALAEKSAPRPLGADGVAVAPTEPGVYRLELSAGARSRRLDGLELIVQVPFHLKEDGYLNGYHIGRYPTEGRNRTDRYAPPAGFIEVTPENQSLRVSEHFRLREFLTKDQRSVWPKYVVVDPRLLDKLELVMQDLNAHGIRAERMAVMSGFRTPQYNRKGLSRGRASLSRHQYGDAADVWIDNDGDWYMDDLNGDGRRDTRDARVMRDAVDRVERRHPELVGGAGIYRDNGVHGPFIHIDARGYRARW